MPPSTPPASRSLAAPLVGMVAKSVETDARPECGHLVPDERPDAVVAHILKPASRAA